MNWAVRRHRLRWYWLTLVLLAVATAATALAKPWLGTSFALFFFPAVVTAAMYGGYGPAVFGSIASTVLAAFFYGPTQQEIEIGMDDAIRFAVLSGVSLTIAALSAARQAAQEAERQSLVVIAQQGQELAVREDRIRVARDLHDGVLQALTGIRLELHDLSESVGVPAPVHDRLLATERALAIEQRELRGLVDELNPRPAPRPDSETLDAALRKRVARLSLEWKTPISVHVMPSDLSVEPAIEQAIGLMCQEATINALKHAHPTRVSISVAGTDAELRLTVVDDGRGFPFSGRLEHQALVERNVGPVTLRDRANSLGGRLSVESGSRGSRVEITLPHAAA